MYRCCKCRSEFEEFETKDVIAEEYLGISHLCSDATRLSINICPMCGCEDIEELEQCNCCEEWYYPDELIDTTEFINGGCGYCCEECIEDSDMTEI